MANYYVWSGATGSGTGTSWTDAFTKLNTAVTGKAGGDIFFVAHDHAETTGAGVTITMPGTDANASRVFCVNRAGSVPPVAADLRTTATITTTGTFQLAMNGSCAECYGITFSSSTGATITNLGVGTSIGRSWRLVACKFILGNTATTSRIVVGTTASFVTFENCTVQFGDVAQTITPVGRVTIRNTVAGPFVQGSVIPTILFTPSSGGTVCLVEGADLNASGSGKTLLSIGSTQTANVILKDCKLGASVTLVTGTPAGPGGAQLTLIRTDSGDTNYRVEYHNMMGSQVIETTIVRTGGASDGTTPIAWKVATITAASPANPFECLPISIWNESTGSPITVTIEGIWDTGAVPTCADIWIEVEYLGTSGFPLGNRASSGLTSLLETATNVPAGSGTWGGSTTKFAMSATITPQEKGPITIYVKAMKSASTFYIDPKPVIT